MSYSRGNTAHTGYCIHKNKCDFQKTHFFHIYFSEGVQLIAEVARSKFLFIAFISQQAF